MNKTFVLIHGTWHGGWAWQEVVRCLAEKGHVAYAPTSLVMVRRLAVTA